MRNVFRKLNQLSQTFAITSLLVFSFNTMADPLGTLVDNFSNETSNNLGIPRQFMDDTMVGGNTNSKLELTGGVMHLKGEIVPPRGQPGWASTVLILESQGQARDASAYEGIKLLIKLNSGSLSVSANSTEVDNFDYHSAIVSVKSNGEFHEVKIPFSAMKRTWSEQTELDVATLNSLSIVAFAMQKATFDYELDEVSFY